MSPYNCMSFSKWSYLGAENVMHFKQSFLDGFYASENQNIRKYQTENKTR